jgi:molybdate transport system ATP-binding protein
MSLEVDVEQEFGAFRLRARFAATGRLTALFGRSGSGKTSLVNLIAGLSRPTRGRIAVGDAVLFDTERRLAVPAHRRRIGYVFQEARLFPHLTVRQNLLFGRVLAPRAEPGPTLEAVVALLGIESLLTRRPARLSGGERQRVAIGRALLAKPRLLLMDEPLASLDEARKAEILPFIERLRDEAGVPMIYVSHAVAEVARLATTVVALADGQVTAVGPAAEVLRHAGADAAEAGSLLVGRLVRHDEADGLSLVETRAGLVWTPRVRGEPGTAVRLRVPARDVLIALRPPDALSALNMIEARVRGIEPLADRQVMVTLDCRGEAIGARLTRRSVEALRLAPGLDVVAIIKGVAVEPL